MIDTLRKVTGRSSGVVERVAGLQQAADAARGRLDPAVVADADAVVESAAERLRLSSEHTVVAIAGATGSGKSSLFNALCGLDLAAVGLRRPTTSWALACAWGPDGAHELLDWLGIPKRHQVTRMGMLDESAADRKLHGLVLLDLPDHDSTEVSHHLEVERLVRLADVLVWVLDPQKYADAAVHDRFLRKLAEHSQVVMVVLNHIDEIPPAGAEACLVDVHRLLGLDGLADVPVIGTSATRGDGLSALREALAKRVSRKRSAKERLSADVKACAARLAEHTGDARPGDVRLGARAELLEACADAAGVPVVVRAIEAASLQRARQATGWPPTSWLSRLRRDPLRRLDLDARDKDALTAEGRQVTRTRLRPANSVQRARVDAAVRTVADDVSAGTAAPWGTAIRSVSVARVDDFADVLDGAMAKTDLEVSREPWWWMTVRVLQWLLLLTALVGGLWLGALAGFDYLRLPAPGTVDVGALPLPTLLLVAGVGLGVVIAVLCRFAAKVSARRRARRADHRLRVAIETVCDELVVGPIQAEVAAYLRCRDGVRAALAR